MKVLLVAATLAEVHAFLANAVPVQAPHPFMQGRLFATYLERRPVEVLITGIGMVNTALALGALRPTANVFRSMVNLGICGSFSAEHPVGSVVEVVEDTFGELGAQDGPSWQDLQQLGFALFEHNGQPVYNRLTNPHPSALAYPEVRGVTHNQVSGNPETIEQTLARWQPAIESMEGAAVLQAALQANIPFAAFRAVSNRVAPRSQANWQMQPAIEAAQTAVREYLRAQ